MKKLFALLSCIVAALCLIVIPLQAHAGKPVKAKPAQMVQPTKERLVLMPLRLGEADASRQAAMEIALLEGLQQKYEVFSGEQVAKKARAIFLKESRNTAHKECDETRCLQGIAEAFQAELLAVASVSKQEDGYFLALSVQNIFDNKVVYSKSMPCKGCDAYQVVDKLKELSGVGDNTEANEVAMAAERKLKAEQLKQEQLAFEQKLRDADASERKRLLEAKAQDDKRLAELKVAAEARRKNTTTQPSGVFPTVASAVVEIQRLKDRISAIETGYEKELAQTRQQVSQRYATQLAALDKAQRDEFETAADFKAKQDQKRSELTKQREDELARLNIITLAAAEVAPLRDKIKVLSEREYAVSAESLVIELGTYNAEAQQFPVSIRSKIPNLPWAMAGTIPLPIADAKLFKQQWSAGLVRAETKIKPTGESTQVALVNDADSTHLNNVNGVFRNEELANWQVAQTQDTVQAMQFYLDKYPMGNHVAAANAKLTKLKEEITSVQAKVTENISGDMIHIPGKNYELGKYEVTQKEWRDIMGDNPSFFTACGDNCPVEQVSWNDIQEYLQKLNTKTGRQYRLPTEAEWEYACYGGTDSIFGSPDYCGGDNIDSVAWYNGNSNQTTHPVGQKQANGYGLYDMSGNVWEWMQDWYDSSRKHHSLRGGSWGSFPQYARAAERDLNWPSIRNSSSGFRLARTLP